MQLEGGREGDRESADFCPPNVINLSAAHLPAWPAVPGLSCVKIKAAYVPPFSIRIFSALSQACL